MHSAKLELLKSSQPPSEISAILSPTFQMGLWGEVKHTGGCVKASAKTSRPQRLCSQLLSANASMSVIRRKRQTPTAAASKPTPEEDHLTIRTSVSPSEK